MSTTAQNTQVRAKGDSLPYPIDNTGSNDFNAGDLLWYDATAHVVKALDSDAHAATLVGVAKDSSSLNITGTAKRRSMAEVLTGGLFSFKTTAAETYNHGTALYIGADAQTITTVAGSHIVGYAWLREDQGAVTGAAGQNIDVLIAPSYPAVGVN